MKGKSPNSRQPNLFKGRLKEQLDPSHPLYKLAKAVPWQDFETALSKYYSTKGRPAKPIRLMVGLLILKQLRNLSDERVVAEWQENPYFQYFCGEVYFKWEPPCDPSELVYFRKRIGEEEVKKILEVSIKLHGRKAKEKEVLIDT